MSTGPLRVVLDTNIIVSAVLRREGLESKILGLVLSGQTRLYLSLPILNEYAEVLARPKFRLSFDVRQQIIQGLQHTGITVTAQM